MLCVREKKMHQEIKKPRVVPINRRRLIRLLLRSRPYQTCRASCTHIRKMSNIRFHSWGRRAVFYILIAFLFSCVAASSSISLAVPRKTLANEYACLQADRSIDIVLSYFKEDLNAVRSKLELLQSHPFVANSGCVHLYTKLSLADDDAFGLNATVVVKTHNMGRESGAHLHYILANYNNLPRHAIFLQADVEEIDHVLTVLNQATAQMGFLGLGRWDKCSCDNCNLIPGKLVRMREIWALATGAFCLGDFQANFRGQMLVSRDRIQRHRPDFYLLLRRSLFAQPGHVLHEDDRYIEDTDFKRFMRTVVDSNGHDSLFGHVMERMWTVIFDCYGEEAPNGCLN